MVFDVHWPNRIQEKWEVDKWYCDWVKGRSIGVSYIYMFTLLINLIEYIRCTNMLAWSFIPETTVGMLQRPLSVLSRDVWLLLTTVPVVTYWVSYRTEGRNRHLTRNINITSTRLILPKEWVCTFVRKWSKIKINASFKHRALKTSND